jgi:hypothetical protein
MTVVDLKVPKRAKRGLPLEQASGAARFFGRMVREIESDLGGHRALSRVTRELVQGFAGAATQVEYLNHQLLIGESSELDFTAYAQLVSTMLRVGSRLGLSRRPRELNPSEDPDEYLRRLHDQQQACESEPASMDAEEVQP